MAKILTVRTRKKRTTAKMKYLPISFRKPLLIALIFPNALGYISFLVERGGMLCFDFERKVEIWVEPRSAILGNKPDPVQKH